MVLLQEHAMLNATMLTISKYELVLTHDRTRVDEVLEENHVLRTAVLLI